MSVHDFAEDLAFSRSQSDAPFWEPVYRKAFPTLLTCSAVPEDGWHQRAGIDRVLTLANSKCLYVDEKARRGDWPDILVEIWSDERRRIHGWSLKPLGCDFIAYAFVPTQTCYLLPFPLLQRALERNGSAWLQLANDPTTGFRVVRAMNRGYVTVSLAVPTMVLLDAIRDVMIVTWTDADIRQGNGTPK